MRNYDVTETVTKQHPILQELLTEREFQSYLEDQGVELSTSSLRDYRQRDTKYPYIRQGQQVFYPLYLIKAVLNEFK